MSQWPRRLTGTLKTPSLTIVIMLGLASDLMITDRSGLSKADSPLITDQKLQPVSKVDQF